MTLPKSRFVRRTNTDGSVDSICCNCFVTVATAKSEFELYAQERSHVCSPVLLKHWKELAEGKRSEDSIYGRRCSFCFA